MDFKLTVVASIPVAEPTRAYFAGLEQRARVAMRTACLHTTQAWSLCEFLDAVDAGNLALEREFYRRCVAALGAFLQQFKHTAQARRLAERSWAAHSLLELVLQQQPVGLRAVA